ncbi:trna(ile)-lysidine synthetase [hydrocarbon metagenome]|uniref:tRNA(Ile)-lysidine synthetase n=1 Tax=hydrocarbon metagenome TaxID=938273 RepID=A0A0W8FTW3_9ZZZZ
MIEKVKKTIKKYNLLKKGDRVVVALSGGPDSTALFAVLVLIAQELNLDLIIAHFNHGLRGEESDKDEKKSRDLAEKRGFVFVSEKMNHGDKEKGISPEDFYRRERYNFLNKVAEDYQAQKIALGHNMQDQAETVLLNLLRGSGLEGLKGFLPIRDGKFIRPLIETSREEIITFLNKEGIRYCEDSSNKNSKYLRNQIRYELIPFLKEKFNPKIEENLAQMAEILRSEDEYVKQCIANTLKSLFIQKRENQILFKIDDTNKLHPALRFRLYKILLESFSPAKNGFSFPHIKALDNLVQKCESGKRIVLPLGIEARCEYDDLILERKRNISEQKGYEYTMNVPGSLYIKERKLTILSELTTKENFVMGGENKVYLDFDKIQQPLIIRNRRNGDWFQPLGMQGRQKIKVFFIDHKVPRGRRDEIMLFVDGISVIWIENMHLNDRVKINANTKNVLKLSIVES